MSMSTRFRRLVGSGLALGVTAAVLSLTPGAPGTSAAQAATGGGSIVYVKANNIWITDGDGMVKRQVTTGGTASRPWQSPTQSDNGVVVAYRDGLIYRMNQRGEVFNTLKPALLRDSIGNVLDGRSLSSTAISPDGTKIAYTYEKLFGGIRRWVTGVTESTKITDPGRYDVSYYANPSWVTNSRLLVNAWYRNKSHFFDIGVRDIPWFSERDYTPNPLEFSDLEVSRDSKWLVGVRGDEGDQSVAVMSLGGDVRTTTNPWKPIWNTTNPCDIGRSDGNLREPTIAPDGSTVAWAEPAGIFRASDMNCDPATTRVDILVAVGGSDPSWSRAVIGRTPEVPRPVKKHLRLTKKARILGTAKAGRTLMVFRGGWSPSPQRFQLRWLRDGKPIARANAVRYRLTQRDRGHTISVKVNAIRIGWLTSTTTTARVRVRR